MINKVDPILNSRFSNLNQASQIDRFAPLEFQDYLFGFGLELSDFNYKSITNFNRVKWNEDFEVGWKLSTQLYRNLDFLQTRNSKFFLKHFYSWFNIFNKHFFSTNHSLEYFINPLSDNQNNLSEGLLESNFQYQWRFSFWTASFLNLDWDQLFNSHPSKQFTLGTSEDLTGFPNRFFADRTRFLAQLEQRYFPHFEVFAAIPVFAVFLKAGNTFSSLYKIDLTDLNYSIGFGARLGLTRSVQGIINHLDFSFPLNNRVSKFKVSLTAKMNL